MSARKFDHIDAFKNSEKSICWDKMSQLYTHTCCRETARRFIYYVFRHCEIAHTVVLRVRVVLRISLVVSDSISSTREHCGITRVQHLQF